MKKIALYSIFTLFVGFGVKAQDCETLVKDCEKILKGKEQNFVSDGQVYTAFLDREKAEFKTTEGKLRKLLDKMQVSLVEQKAKNYYLRSAASDEETLLQQKLGLKSLPSVFNVESLQQYI